MAVYRGWELVRVVAILAVFSLLGLAALATAVILFFRGA